MRVHSKNPAFVNSTGDKPATAASATKDGLPVNSSEGYFEPIAGDYYVEPSSTKTTDVSGYLVPDDDSSVPSPPCYIEPLPSPPPSPTDVLSQELMTSDDNPNGPNVPDAGYLTPFEGGAGEEHYLNLSAENTSPDTYIELQLENNNVANPSVEPVRVSSQMSDDGDLSPIIKNQYALTEMNFHLPSNELANG